MINKYQALALALLSSVGAQAQDAARAPQLVRGTDGLPELIQFRAGAAPSASDAQAVLRSNLGLPTQVEMRALRTEADGLGFTHQKFQQYYNGVKVEHATYSVHARNNAIESLSGDAEQLPEGFSVRPALSSEAALQSALGFVRAQRYMWQDAAQEALLKQQNGASATYRPTGELVIVRNNLSIDAAKQNQPTLAWKFDVYAQQPISRAYIYVDAQTGEIVAQDAIIKHAAANGSLATRYSGTQTTTTDSYNGTYRLRDVSRGSGIETYNCKKGSTYTNTDFTDADNSWTEYNNTNYDNAALDAHWGAQSVYDYWKNVHGRNSYNNAGAAIRSYVHFDDTPGDGKGYENAFWDGTRMTYGDGYTRFQPLTSLDVCAHEIGHAICSYTANLTYSNESGALNEGFSDIWGAAVEYYKAPAKQTWLIGEDIDKSRPSLRSMSNPNAEGQPDTYKGTYWYTGTGDYGGVHTNSGVLNHWFYRLAVGGSGTNDIGSSFSVTGIGIDAAAKIAYRTESVYLTASSTYASTRTASIQAAKDLYGAGSAQEISVTNAWYAVGVGAAYGGGTTTPPTTGTPTYCTSKGTNVSYEWIDLVQLGSINRSSGKDAGYYDGTALSTSVAAGSSQTIYISAGFTSSAYTEYWKIYIDWNQDGDFTDASETVVSGSSSSSGTLSASFTVPSTAKTGKARLRVIMSDNSATTSCGTYSYGETEDYSVNVTGGTFAPTFTSLTGTTPLGNAEARTATVFPNPATEQLTLLLPDNAKVSSVKVYDVRGAEVKQVRLSEEGQLDVSQLRPGIYQLSISDGQKAFQSRFTKQ